MTATEKRGDLTDTAFWRGYWGSFSLPAAIDERRSFDRTLAAGLRDILRGSSGSALEIGCAPGRWLAYLADEFGYRVFGIEYTAEGADATRRNLEILGVRDAEVREGDFFTEPPSPTYDLVISLGFVEHFTDVTGVIARHGAWTRPGGRIIIGVPNFLSVHGTAQGILDAGVLGKHNLSIMSTDKLRELGVAAGLEPESARYLGSFEPALPIAQAGVKNVAQLITKTVLRVARIARNAGPVGKMMDSWNGPRVSSYILASFRKPA